MSNETITPDQAREHLAWPEGKDHPKVRDGDGQAWFKVQGGQAWFEVQGGESHPYWNQLLDAPYEDAVMYAVARPALTTIAGMHEEWGYEYEALHGLGRATQWGFKTEAAATRNMENALRRNWDEHQPTRIVRRYVTEAMEA